MPSYWGRIVSIISLKYKKKNYTNSWCDGKATLKVWFNYRAILIGKVNLYCLSRCKLSTTIFLQYYNEKCKTLYSLFSDLCMKTLSKLGTEMRSQELVGSSIKIVDLKMSTRKESLCYIGFTIAYKNYIVNCAASVISPRKYIDIVNVS